MGGEQYVYSEGDAAWFSTFLVRAEKTSKGMNGISLTEYSTSVLCAVAAGSVVEIDGAFFHFDDETSVTGAVATGMNYIICSVTGTTASPYWSQDIFSTYDTVKAGLYTGSAKYVAECHYGHISTEYEGKYVYPERTRELKRVVPIGTWVMTTTNVVQVAHGLDTIFLSIKNVAAHIHNDNRTVGLHLDRYSLDDSVSAPSGIVQWTSADVVLQQHANSLFHSVNYNSDDFNRGYITLWYII